MLRTRSVSAARRGSPCSSCRKTPVMSAHTRLWEFLLAQLVPEIFLGIELGRIGRQAVAADVFWDQQGLGHEGTGSHDDHDDEVVGVSDAPLRQKMAHQCGVHFPSDHSVQLAFQRADRAVNRGEFAFVAVVHQWRQFPVPVERAVGRSGVVWTCQTDAAVSLCLKAKENYVPPGHSVPTALDKAALRLASAAALLITPAWTEVQATFLRVAANSGWSTRPECGLRRPAEDAGARVASGWAGELTATRLVWAATLD